MQAGKKYTSNGVQCAMYPNPVMNITQSINGAYSHRGTNAIDDAQANNGISHGYAPCDVKCVKTDYANGNFIVWESVNPVQTVSHGKQYIHFYVGHDNTANAYVGMTISQGTQLFSEGTAGNATGNHNHIEVALGKFAGTMYVLNSYGVYMLPGNINPAEVFYVDDTQIINNGGLSWKKIGGSSSGGGNTGQPDQILEVGSKVKFVNNLKVEKYNASTGLIYNSRIGGWINPSICYEDSANDGAQDQYFANTNATFTILGTFTVGSLRKVNGVWDAYLNELGFWVHCEPLIELQNGNN